MFVSTNGKSRHTFSEMLFTGYCEDGGILMPESIPALGDLDRFRELTFGELAFEIVKLYCPEEEIPHETLRSLIVDAHKRFGHADVVTVVPTADNGLAVAELFHGPSHAFKDIAMQVMGPLLNYIVERRKERAICVISTTGDTGPSVIEALKDLPRISVIVMYPKTEPRSVSSTQELQMISTTAKNVRILATATCADDNDEAMLALFADAELRKSKSLTTINSINFGRLLVGIAQFVFLYLRVAKGKEQITFSIPSGSFGNATACFVTQKMGLNIRILVVNNANHVTDTVIRTGVYAPESTVINTVAPAIDCQTPYNFQRVLFLLNRDKCADWCLQMRKEKRLELPEEDLKNLQAVFSSSYATDVNISETIERVWNESRYLVDPHTAVAIYGAKQHLESSLSASSNFIVALSTAHPAKFSHLVEKCVGFKPPLPFGLRFIRDLPTDWKYSDFAVLRYPAENNVASVEKALRDIVNNEF